MMSTARSKAFSLLFTAFVGACGHGARDGDDGWGESGEAAAPLPTPGNGFPPSSGSGGQGGSSVSGGGPAMSQHPPSATGGSPASVAPTNPFVATAHDPYSTFAADVDTASYDIFRRDITLGHLPAPSQVRLEEFVNAFKYDYPAPDIVGATPFAVGLKAAVSPFASGTTLLRVHVQGKPAEAFEKKPTNLVYLIDVSGSMDSSDKLPLVKQVARQSLDILDATDKVSIVTYAGDTRVRLAPTPAANKAQIRGVIDALVAGGSTAGASGIEMAYAQAQAAFIEGGINHVVLCTDGDFNVGISSTEALVDMIEGKRKTGITLTALGFGAHNLNDEMMERVTNAGNGIYAVISNEAQAATYVRESLLSSIVHIAQDVKIQVEFNPNRVTAYRLLGYENRDIADRDFRNDAVDAGEIGAGHQVTALYELALAGTTVPAPAGAPPIKNGAAVPGLREVSPAHLATVKVRYKAPGAKESDPALEVSGHLGNDDVVTTLSAADADMQWAAAVAALTEILKKSPFANMAGLSTIATIVEQQKTRDPARAEFSELFAKTRTIFAP